MRTKQASQIQKRRKKRSKLSLLFVGICVAGASIAAFNLTSAILTYRAINAFSREIRESYVMMAPDNFRHIDWEALQARNEDVVAWIYFPGTHIDYPILAGVDNDEYLHLNLDRQFSLAGSIFLEENNSHQFTDQNTIIYGHHIFGLYGFERSKFSDIHEIVAGNVTGFRYVYIYLPDHTVLIYRVVSAQATTIYSMIYHQPVQDEFAFFTEMFAGNVLNVDFDLIGTPRTITLSTCEVLGAYDPRRSVVFGVLVDEVTLNR